MKLKAAPDYTQWHRVFAWFPVEVAPGDVRWLERVERRIYNYVQTYAGDACDVEYRAIASA